MHCLSLREPDGAERWPVPAGSCGRQSPSAAVFCSCLDQRKRNPATTSPLQLDPAMPLPLKAAAPTTIKRSLTRPTSTSGALTIPAPMLTTRCAAGSCPPAAAPILSGRRQNFALNSKCLTLKFRTAHPAPRTS
uniref:Uncharacterized protein n=1 Tax=Macrostomum lignano TaxID=282301 RepID=A0A1I8I3X7_9PLAT